MFEIRYSIRTSDWQRDGLSEEDANNIFDSLAPYDSNVRIIKQVVSVLVESEEIVKQSKDIVYCN